MIGPPCRRGQSPREGVGDAYHGVQRWPDMDRDTIWAHLVRGEPFNRRDLPQVDGRLDLRGLVTEGVTRVEGALWENIDFSEAGLPRLQLFRTTIRNCRFVNAKCRSWGMWGNTIEDTSFAKADLRDAGIGGIDGGRWNVLRRVDFAQTDLRGAMPGPATFGHCTFDRAKLKKVEFRGSQMVDCQFIGPLEEVIFGSRAPRDTTTPPNQMIDVDFSRAQFRMVGFEKLALDRVIWPDDDEHIVVDDYPAVVDRILARLEGQDDVRARSVLGLYSWHKKWLVPEQEKGVVSLWDLRKYGGQAMVDEILPLLRPDPSQRP